MSWYSDGDSPTPRDLESWYGEERVCGRCKHHTYEKIDRGYVCTNADSLYCTEWTDYNDTCDCFEQRGYE